MQQYLCPPSYLYMYAATNVYDMCAYVHNTYVYIYIYMCVCVSIHKYVRAYIHTYIHTYIWI